MEENSRMGKTRDLLKKIRDIKGTFHAKMGSITDGNGMGLTYHTLFYGTPKSLQVVTAAMK